MTRVIERLIQAVRDAKIFNSEVQVAPACILWPDSDRQWQSAISQLIEELPELSIFPGSERLLLPALKAGGAGCISATANANSMEMRQTYDAFERGVEGIEERQERLNSIRSIFEQFAFAPALKTWLASTQSESRWLNLRPPLLKLSEKQSEQLFIDLQKVGFGMV